MKRLALFAASGLIAVLPSIASARPFFFWGFHFGVPVPVVAPPAIVAPAPAIVASPWRPAYYYHPGYDFGYRHPYFYRPCGFARYHYWHWR